MLTLFFEGEDYFGYGFEAHPLSAERHEIALKAMVELLNSPSIIRLKTEEAAEEQILLFHTKEYVEKVKELSKEGRGMIDPDTPCFKGMYEKSAHVVYASCEAIELLFAGEARASFNMVGGLHHAFPNSGRGFCIFNDAAIAIKLALKLGFQRIFYFDIDAHHGDGVFYAFYEDPRVWIADIHQFPLYPGTGLREETGKGKARGTKLNLPLPPFAGDKEFLSALKEAIEFGCKAEPSIICMQAGADCIKGDPLTQLNVSLRAYKKAVREAIKLAEERGIPLLIWGGGGYNYENCAKAWSSALKLLIES